MRIVDAREITVPIGSSMRNAAIDFSGMTVSIAALVTDETRDGKPVIGYGFNSNGRYAQGGILRERLFPRILAASPDSLCDPDTGMLDPARIWDAAMRNEKPGGHGERAVAMAVIDMAAWDLAAKLAGLALHVLLAELFPHASRSTTAAVYAAGGYYTDGGIADVQRELLGYVDEGYRAVKMKVGGAPLDEDVNRIEAVRSVLPDKVTLAVDANARLDLETAVEYAKRLEPYDLAWFEEPCAPLDYAAFARLTVDYSPPLATGENLLSADDFENLLRYGGLRPDRDVLQPDPGLAYGLTEFLRMLDLLRDHGWLPRRVSLHGGHQLSLALTAAFDLGPCESYPGLFAPIGGFADGSPIDDGIIGLPEVPGIGLELKSALLPVLRSLASE
jgi:L-alanine-DL-glutamate epimerase-like enolase superfamily enzyme